MKERILTQWTLPRALFLIMGIMVIVQSTMSHQWFGILFGAYFAAMGLKILASAIKVPKGMSEAR